MDCRLYNPFLRFEASNFIELSYYVLLCLKIYLFTFVNNDDYTLRFTFQKLLYFYVHLQYFYIVILHIMRCNIKLSSTNQILISRTNPKRTKLIHFSITIYYTFTLSDTQLLIIKNFRKA